MEELLERIAKCVELGKINEKTPYLSPCHERTAWS